MPNIQTTTKRSGTLLTVIVEPTPWCAFNLSVSPVVDTMTPEPQHTYRGILRQHGTVTYADVAPIGLLLTVIVILRVEAGRVATRGAAD